ncbi:MAG: GreA/GreB family elongation factor [Acidobacteriota bacterium]
MGIREMLLGKIKAQIAPLERELKIELPRLLAEAAAHGDLSENAEYDAAKQRKEIVQAHLATLYKKKASVSSINPEMIARDAIGFWSSVQLCDRDSGDEVTYRLVTAGESDPPHGMISVTSPIGRALLGRRTGDEVVVDTPRGKRTYEVLEFATIHQDPESV